MGAPFREGGVRLDDGRHASYAVPRPVKFWHGRVDWQAPLPGARLLATAIPMAGLRVLSGEGHFLGFDHGAEILTELSTT